MRRFPAFAAVLLCLVPLCTAIGVRAQEASAILVPDETPYGHMEYYKVPSQKASLIAPSRIDYSKLAQSLTQDCETDYERLRSINNWISLNIAYDTSLKVRTADDCYKKRKGVCQAYCELFYWLAKCLDIRVELVTGIYRDIRGNIPPETHAWLFAYTQPNYGILIDPSWDAGTVDGKKFTFRDAPGTWFNVNPEWMILYHLPDDPSYQLIDPPMTREEFAAMPAPSTLCNEYGMNYHELFVRTRNRELKLPRLYSGGEGIITRLDIPFDSSLRIGESYWFRVELSVPEDFILWDGYKVYSTQDGDWASSEDGVMSLQFMPTNYDRPILLGFRESLENGRARVSTFVEYDMDTPTPEDWDRLASALEGR